MLRQVELASTLEAIGSYYERFKSASSSASTSTAGAQSVTKLTWLHSFGRGELQPRYGKFSKSRPLKLDCNTHQASLLLLFNAADALTLGEISTRLGMNIAFVKKQAMSLCLGKYKVCCGA